MQIFTAPYADARRRSQLPRVRALPPGHSASTRRLRPRETVDGRKSSLTRRRKGFASCSGTRYLRAQAGCTGTSNFFSNVAFAIISCISCASRALRSSHRARLLHRERRLVHRRLLRNAHLSQRFGIGPTTIAAAAMLGDRRRSWSPSRRATRPYPSSSPRICCRGFSIVVYNIIQVSYRQAICPPRLQGRMNSVMRFIVWGTFRWRARSAAPWAPGSAFARRSWIGAVGGSLSTSFWFVFSPQRHAPRDARADMRRRAGTAPGPSRCVTPPVAARRPLAPSGLSQALVGRDDQPVRVAGRALAIGFVAILVLDASAFEVAVLGTLNFLPFILFTLPAGVWIDRLRRRPILIAGDFAPGGAPRHCPDRLRRRRADALAALRRRLPHRHLHGLLRRGVPVVPAVARRARSDHRRQLEARDLPLRGSRRGPRLRRGARRDLHGPPTPLLVDAVSFLGSGMFLLGIRSTKRLPWATVRQQQSRAFKTELKEGLRFVLDNPNLRAQAGCTAHVQPLLERSRSRSSSSSSCASSGSRPGVIGIVFSIGATARSPRLHGDTALARFGIGPTTIAVATVWGPATLLVALAPAGNAAIPFLVVALLLFSSPASSTTSSR